MPITFLEYRQLQELFDRPYKWKIENNMGSEYIKVSFRTESGKKYDVTLIGSKDMYVDFEDENGKTVVTGEGGKETFKIYATVIDIIRYFAEQFSTTSIEFISVKSRLSNNRAILYKKMVEKLIPNHWRLKVYEEENTIRYIINIT